MADLVSMRLTGTDVVRQFHPKAVERKTAQGWEVDTPTKKTASKKAASKKTSAASDSPSEE